MGEGRYRADLSPRWNLRLPQGGVVSAVALRAMAAELGDPTQSLRTSHTTFAAQVAHGPLDVEVEVRRRGRPMSQLRAEVRNVGAAGGHLTIATVGSSRSGPDLVDLTLPVAPPAEGCVSFAEGVGRSDRPWFGPSVDLTFHRLADCGDGWILGHNRARHAGDGYASADMALWDMTGDPTLVAYATQVFFFTYLG